MFDVYVDSAANIPAELVGKHGITVLPMKLTLNGKPVASFEPGLTPEQERQKGHEFYQAMRDGARLQTSLVNTEEFVSAMRVSLEKGNGILAFTMSFGISGTYKACRLAIDELKEEFPDRKLYLIDSMNASLGEGLLALYAVEMRDQGKDLDEIYEYLSKTVPKMNGIFTVDDLSYLASTGRLSNTSAFVGNLLGVKPLLKGSKDGYIVAFKKVRGRKKSISDLINYVINNVVDPENQILGIAHADAYEESLYIMEKIQEKIKVRDFINTTYDFGTGSHVGPDTIALFFIGEDRELSNGSEPKSW
ncbi:MAG: DegV family protein [Erysipelotrichaceae bacterium]|nr:DegV family protein [Erysipelotrichaceae bacterium]